MGTKREEHSMNVMATTTRFSKNGGLGVPYATGENPMIGDLMSDKRGRVGTVTAAFTGGIFTISWNDGMVGANYTMAERFALIARSSENAET